MRLDADDSGPPTQIKVTTSELERHQVDRRDQGEQHDGLDPGLRAGTTAAIVVTGTKVNQSLASELALQVTDVAGNVTEL